MGKETPELPDEGSNPTDDEMPSSALQGDAGDLSREEVVEEIRGLEPRQQAELVALLMWLGRDDADGEEFEQLVTQALERREVPRRITFSTILSSPSIGSRAWSALASEVSLETRGGAGCLKPTASPSIP